MEAVHLFGSRGHTAAAAGPRRFQRRAGRGLAMADGGGAVTTLCRDCSALAAAPAQRCEACGSPRLVAHRELAALSVAHVDCDAFYATVENGAGPSWPIAR